jgi:hypothetical protein
MAHPGPGIKKEVIMLTGAELTDEIQVLVGRPGGTDEIVDNTRCARWINECKRQICEEIPGIEKLKFKNTTSLDTTVTLSYALSEITVGDLSNDDRICHIYDVWYLDGLESRRLKFVHSDEFDAKWPDPTHADMPRNIPIWWTRRGDNIEMYPLCATAYANKDLRFDGDYYDADFTTNDASASDISGADNVIIAYGVWKAWMAIGNQIPGASAEAIKAQANYTRELDDFRQHEESLTQWDGNMYSDGIP